tara:strand:+ start:41 stop:232 length:192 start_codon:yes stop_codon:yes gene_type:complete
MMVVLVFQDHHMHMVVAVAVPLLLVDQVLVMLEQVVLEHNIVFQELLHTMQVVAVDLIQKQVE